MASPNDNLLPRSSPPGPGRPPGRRRRLGEALAGVLLGNGVYFLLLFPRLPPSWQHQPFALDRGLALDFLLCLASYLLLRRLRRSV